MQGFNLNKKIVNWGVNFNVFSVVGRNNLSNRIFKFWSEKVDEEDVEVHVEEEPVNKNDQCRLPSIPESYSVRAAVLAPWMLTHRHADFQVRLWDLFSPSHPHHSNVEFIWQLLLLFVKFNILNIFLYYYYSA